MTVASKSPPSLGTLAIGLGVVLANDGGFTLVEVLVAVALFALIATIAHVGLSSLMVQDDALRDRSEQLDRLSSSVQLLKMDLLQALPRSSRDGLGDTVPAFRVRRDDGLTIEFTRAGTGAPFEGGLNRVRYRYQRGTLSREVDSVLDGVVKPGRGAVVQLLSWLKNFEVEVLGVDGQPLPEDQQPAANPRARVALPAALKVRLDTVRWGLLERTLLVGG